MCSTCTCSAGWCRHVRGCRELARSLPPPRILPDPLLRPEKALCCYAMSAFLCLASLLLLGNGYASGEAVVAFDGAAASSTYAGKEFAAQEAMSKGSGYWCRYRDTHRFACVGAVRSTVMCVQCWKPCPWPDCSLDGYACRTAEGRWCDPELVRCSCLRAVVLQDRCRQ